MIHSYIKEVYEEKDLKNAGYSLNTTSDTEKDIHRAVFTETETGKEVIIVTWDENGYREPDIQFKDLESIRHQSLIKALDFYLKSKNNTQSHIIFKNYKNFMTFFDIIVVGSLKKIW